MKSSIPAAAFATLLAIMSDPALAEYPMRPVRIIMPLPSGGPSDAAARLLGQPLSKAIGQPIIIDNRPGAGGAIAAQLALAASPDGYTLLWGISSMVALPLLQKSPPYQSLAELAPVSLVGRFNSALFVYPGVPANSVKELVQYARANPNKLTFATGTLGEFMTTAQFMKATGIEMFRVPYKGGAQAMTDLLAGRIQVHMTPIQLGLPHARAGKLLLLASVHPRRSAVAPDVPTLAELGVLGVSTPSWQALLAPLKSPPAIIAKLSKEITQALREADIQSRLEQQAFVVEGAGPDALKTVIMEDFARWAAFVRENDIPKE